MEKKGKPIIARNISKEVERVLWGAAAARCEFNGCNRRLHISPVTAEPGNYAQKAHIYSFSADGPRGRGPFREDSSGLNEADNLMLVCYDCHKKIDNDKDGKRYSAELLQQWKQAHEARVRMVTEVAPQKCSHVLLYGARIGEESCPLHKILAFEAMFPDWYPADDRPLDITMRSFSDDSCREYWRHQQRHLEHEFDRCVVRDIEAGHIKHLSVFSLAPQPLLVRLGTLITDKVPVVVYQLHREPCTWKWQNHPEGFDYILREPRHTSGKPVLVISLSASICPARIEAILGSDISIWELTLADCHNDFLRSKAQLVMFRRVVRRLLAQIKLAQPNANELAIFPAMPVSCAIELGRVRMPKADMPWVIYDQSNKQGQFIETITIGRPYE